MTSPPCPAQRFRRFAQPYPNKIGLLVVSRMALGLGGLLHPRKSCTEALSFIHGHQAGASTLYQPVPGMCPGAGYSPRREEPQCALARGRGKGDSAVLTARPCF